VRAELKAMAGEGAPPVGKAVAVLAEKPELEAAAAIPTRQTAC